jgi:acyl-CoA thioester hydrolase
LATGPRAADPPLQPFSWPVRVYYEDTDAAGVVYYANYLKFMERARTEWLRALGFEQTDLIERYNVVFVVRALAIEYMRAARFNDGLRVTVELIKVGAGHIELAQRVMKDNVLIASGKVKVVCVEAHTLRVLRIPQPLAHKIKT